MESNEESGETMVHPDTSESESTITGVITRWFIGFGWGRKFCADFTYQCLWTDMLVFELEA